MVQQSIQHLLTQLTRLLTQLSNEEYATALPVLNKSSIGQHVRHVIELFQSLLDGYERGMVNYDNRKRKLVLEIDSSAAIAELETISAQINRQDKELFLAGNYAVQEEEEVQVQTSFSRELIYNLEHSIHHMAIIRIAVQQTSSVSLADDFGIAASTIRHKKACAQ